MDMDKNRKSEVNNNIENNNIDNHRKSNIVKTKVKHSKEIEDKKNKIKKIPINIAKDKNIIKKKIIIQI